MGGFEGPFQRPQRTALTARECSAVALAVLTVRTGESAGLFTPTYRCPVGS